MSRVGTCSRQTFMSSPSRRAERDEEERQARALAEQIERASKVQRADGDAEPDRNGTDPAEAAPEVNSAIKLWRQYSLHDHVVRGWRRMTAATPVSTSRGGTKIHCTVMTRKLALSSNSPRDRSKTVRP